MTALYLERYLNYGLTREELQGGRPIIGIAQTGSDLSPCNRIHVSLAIRARDGIRDAGGVPLEFPCHPIQVCTSTFEDIKWRFSHLSRHKVALLPPCTS